jgi:hypothetical protein
MEAIVIESTAPKQIRVPHVIETFQKNLTSFGYYGPSLPIEKLQRY